MVSLVPLSVKWADYGCSVRSAAATPRSSAYGPGSAPSPTGVSPCVGVCPCLSACACLCVCARVCGCVHLRGRESTCECMCICQLYACMSRSKGGIGESVLDSFAVLLTDDHVYTTRPGPIPWRAPETFEVRSGGEVASPATDVFMLGGSFLELLCGCERTPYDWLGPGVFAYRASSATRAIGPIDVRSHFRPCDVARKRTLILVSVHVCGSGFSLSHWVCVCLCLCMCVCVCARARMPGRC